MAKLDRVTQEQVRASLGRAREEMKAGEATAAVHTCWTAFNELAAAAPDLLTKPLTGPPGAPKMTPAMLWPDLGANLDRAAAGRGELAITFEKETFSITEAMTYYEFVLDAALDA